jgi:hypothetical protein
VLVAQACNPSYSRGRDLEDHASKPAWANRLQNPILKTPITKKRLVEWLKVKDLSVLQKKKKRKKERSQINTDTFHFQIWEKEE